MDRNSKAYSHVFHAGTLETNTVSNALKKTTAAAPNQREDGRGAGRQRRHENKQPFRGRAGLFHERRRKAQTAVVDRKQHPSPRDSTGRETRHNHPNQRALKGGKALRDESPAAPREGIGRRQQEKQRQCRSSLVHANLRGHTTHQTHASAPT